MKNNTQPLVSIGIPTYNRLSGLKRALESIREQTYKNLDIIVSDNCSATDEIDSYMQKAVKDDSRIRFFRQNQNIGALRNFEFVLSKAKGKYFAWAADDDSCQEKFVEEIVARMEQDQSIVLCSCDVKIIDENEDLIRVEYLKSVRPDADWRQTRKLFFRYPTSNIFFCIYGIYNTEILKACALNISRGWKGFLTNGEVPFLAQLSAFGRVVAIPKTYKTYKSHPNSVYHDEIPKISNLDRFMLKFVIRVKLCKLVFFDKSSIKTRILLIWSIGSSFTREMREVRFRDKIPEFAKAPLRPFWRVLRGRAKVQVQVVHAEPIDQFLADVVGLIHVGANTGQERSRYAQIGLNVIWVEPIPYVFETLVNNINEYSNQRAFQYLLTDRPGENTSLHIANNHGESSSIFDLALHRNIWPEVEYKGVVECVSETLKGMINRHDIDLSRHDALVLDTQGSELLILKGAGSILKQFRYIKTEAADFELYKDCCTLDQLGEFLEEAGFKEHDRSIFASKREVGNCFNIVYRRIDDN